MAVVAVVLLGSLIGSNAAAATNEVLPGVTLGGIPVSGLSRAGLNARIAPAAKAIESRSMILYVGKREWSITPRSFGITVDVPRTTASALRAGRGGPFDWLFHSVGLKRANLQLVPKVDARRFTATVRNLAQDVKVQASNGEVSLEGSRVVIKSPSEGVDLVVESAKRQIIAATLRPGASNRLGLPVTLTAPSIGDKEVAKIEHQANGILAAPVNFTFESRNISLDPVAVAASLRVKLVPGAVQTQDSLLLEADPEELRSQIVKVDPAVEKPARSASFETSGDNVKVVPSVDGRSVDTVGAAQQLVTFSQSNRPVIELSPRILMPTLTTEVAMSLGINKKISGFTTYFDPRNAPRVANIDRMATAIDGRLLRPGEVFALNAATGPRTPENGYQEAQVIVEGELVPGIGGGVCQVATTLFNSVFNAGLEVEERSNHSLYISKYPIGRDAMVNYGVQDLRFKNDTEYGLLLRATVTSKAMVVNIYSSSLGRTVETTQSDRRNPKPATTKYIDDPTLPAGQEVVVEEGSPGFDITVTRKVKQDNQVLHEDTFVSKYRPWKRIIRRGTGPAASPTPTPSPSTTGG